MVTRIFVDTEFVIHQGYPHLLSLALVPEEGDCGLYVPRDLDDVAIVGDADESVTVGNLARADTFVSEHVLPKLHRDGDGRPMSMGLIGQTVLTYLDGLREDSDQVQLWGDCPAYDQVALASVFGNGSFQTYPTWILPYSIFDINQEVARIDLPEQLLIQPSEPHRADSDATAVRDQFALCATYDAFSRILGVDHIGAIVDAILRSRPYQDLCGRRPVDGHTRGAYPEAIMTLLGMCVDRITPGESLRRLDDVFERFVGSWGPGKVMTASSEDQVRTACDLASMYREFGFLTDRVTDAMFANTWNVASCECCVE